MRGTGDFDKAMTDFIARQPIGRLATADEVMGIVIHLASDESRFLRVIGGIQKLGLDATFRE